MITDSITNIVSRNSTGRYAGEKFIDIIDLNSVSPRPRVDTISINFDKNAIAGNVTKLITQNISVDAVIRSVKFDIEGKSFNGTLNNYSGCSITESSVQYDTNSEQTSNNKKAFIIDFGGMRKLTEIALIPGSLLPGIVMVIPWMGIEFAEKTLYPFDMKQSISSTPKDIIQFSEIETTKLLIQFDKSIADPINSQDTNTSLLLNELRIVSNTMPLNVRVAIADRTAFYTNNGELKDIQSSPDFSDELNSYLDEIRSQNEADIESVPLTITMDVPGVVMLSNSVLIIDRESTANWGERDRQSYAFDRQGEKNVVLEFPTILSKNWKIYSLSLDVVSDFTQWRFYPQLVKNSHPKYYSEIAVDYNVSQEMEIKETTELFGISLLLGDFENDAEFLVEFRDCIDGVPGDQVYYEQSIKLKRENSRNWIDILLDAPFAITAGNNICFVIKSKTGKFPIVLEELSSFFTKPIFYNRNGTGFLLFPYKNGQLTCVFRQLRKPAFSENSELFTLDIAGEVESSELEKISKQIEFSWIDSKGKNNGPQISPDSNVIKLPLKIIAHASGTITIQNIRARYELT